MLNAPAAQQGALAGALRGKLLRGDTNFTSSELALARRHGAARYEFRSKNTG
jgi:hypothetical protein